MRTHGIRELLTSAAIAIAVVICCACAGGDSQANLQRVFRGIMDASDLPSGWGGRRDAIIKDPIGIARGVTFYGANPRDKPWVNVSQTIMCYPDEQQSAQPTRSP